VSFVDATEMTHCSVRQFTPGVSSLKTKVVCTRVDHESWRNEVICQGNLSVKLTEVTYQSWLWSPTRWRGPRQRLLLKVYKLCGRILSVSHEGWE